MIYRNFLRNAPWNIAELPRQDTPEWFKNNSLVFMTWASDLQRMKALREYFEMPFMVHWYSWHGLHDRDYPHFASSPEVYLKNRELRKMGIRTMAYANGRLFEENDCRDVERDYSKTGKKLAIINKNGSINRENYGTPFAVMCPAATQWQDIMLKFSKKMMAWNFDGIYYDQIGASSPRQCFAVHHGHKSGDMDHWYKYGYSQSLKKIRSWRQKNYPDTVFTTEDNSEVYNKFMDGVLPWRWIHQGQVPFYTLCYSGQVQFIGQSYHFGGKIDSISKYAKAATQLVWGQQIGWFTTGTAVKDTDFMLFVKKLAFCRQAFLNFFNAGMLGREIEFVKSPEVKNILWHRDLEDKFVETPSIISAKWQYGKSKLFLLINYTDKKQNVSFRIPDCRKEQIYIFNSGKNTVPCQINQNLVELNFYPREIIAIVIEKESSKDTKTVENIFNRMRNFKKFEVKK